MILREKVQTSPMMSEPMKVLYIANTYDPLKHSDGSGTDYDIYQTFLEHGLEVSIVGPFNYPPTRIERIFGRLQRLVSKYRPAKYSRSYLQQSAREVESAIEKYQPDIMFSFFSAPLVKANFNVPLVYMLDTTLIGQQAQWPIFSKLATAQMLRSERRVIRKSKKVITLSKWSAEILEKDYNVPCEDLTYFPIPASIPIAAVPNQIEIEKSMSEGVNILLVGRDFRRKGVDIAVEVVRLLNEKGIPSVLRIVGLQGKNTQQVEYMGSYNKTLPDQLKGYLDQYRWAHFLIHPARFEAAGIVPGEAAAFGAPTLTNASGGLATTVEDGVSGVVLPKGKPAEAYVEVVAEYYNDPESYFKLRRTTRTRYDQELNWRRAGDKIVGVLRQAFVL